MRPRALFLFVILLVALLSAFPAAQAQDAIITNLAQLAQEAFSDNNCLYLPSMPWLWQAYANYSEQPWWLDCSQLSCGDLFQAPVDLSAGVTGYRVLLTRNILTGEMILQADDSTNVLTRVAAPTDYQPGQLSSQDMWVWRGWQQSTNCPDCWGIEGEFPAPTVTLKVLLADISDHATYQSNLDAQADAQMAGEVYPDSEIGAHATSAGTMLMDDVSCTTTDEAAPFAVLSIVADTTGVTVTWISCSDHVYGVFSTDALTGTDTVWVGRVGMWGDDGETSWVDTNVTSDVTNRFYKIVRIPPDEGYNGDVIPSGWAVDHGLNPLDPNLDTEDPDGDGQDNYAEYIADTDPKDSSSYFHVTAFLVVGNDVRVFFTSASDRYYNLQRSDFFGGPYSNVVASIPGNGGIQWAKDIGGALAFHFYRMSVFIATNIPPDSDSDGMPDLWTEQYFGHPTGLVADLSRATDNPDSDCFNNLQEYQNGMDPTNRDPVVTVSGGATVCLGETVNLLASTIPGATYSWSGPNGFSSTNRNPSISNATTNMAGNYCVSATVSNCASTNCVTLTVHTVTATVSGSTTICPGVSNNIQAVLTGTAPWIVTWSDGVITTNSSSPASRTVSPSSTTTYIVTNLSDAVCSSGTATGSATVTVNTNVPTSVVVVSNEVLVVYNANVADSASCKNYYINHRPGFSNANVLACSCTTTGTDGFETITKANLTNQIINPIISFIQSNTTKSIHYVVLMYGMPSRVDDTSCNDPGPQPPSVQHHISRCMSDAGYTSGPYYEGSTCPFVATNYLGTTCLVTALNLATLADCTAYVDKVTSMYTGNVIISAKAAGYTNSNYYLDETNTLGFVSLAPFRDAILAQNPSANVTYTSNAIIRAGSNVKGYASWGVHNGVFANTYATDGSVVWSGSSTWWIIETIESFNGQRCCGQGCVERWFTTNAWGGVMYSNTPVGAVSHVQEPGLGGVSGPTYMSLWEEGFLFSECAWASKITPSFQAIGDPLIKQ
jgi:hypothetical protein